ncbi:MAG: dihydroorotase [Bacteroidaceae bacterium]|nr:dihydroorotase [Bacteroidaceae bacterium]
MRILISNPTIVNEGRQFVGSVVIDNNIIEAILDKGVKPEGEFDHIVDATGMFLIPGVIDDHVHFREPGLTEKATIASESRAAAAGGVTSFMEMPNTKPQTTTIEALQQKYEIAANDSVVNYSFWFGATTNNSHLFRLLDKEQVCGIKLFMGASTGNMLVDGNSALEEIFKSATLPIAVHCEDSAIITENARRIQQEVGEEPDVTYHPQIRSRVACYESTKKAIEFAKRYDATLQIMHISTKEEVELLETGENKKITAEATPAHLLFCDKEYSTLGTKIKCNPAIKSEEDREALRVAVKEGKIDLLGTDHAPHRIEDKQGGALKAASGIPTIQFSLRAMLGLCDKGIFDIETIVEKMCHAPARIFNIDRRGYIREGYYADIVLLKQGNTLPVAKEEILSKCSWSPFEGECFNWSIAQTWVNGQCVYADGKITDDVRGRAIRFNR